MRDIHGHAILFVSFGLVRIIFCMSKRRYFHITRSRESIKTSIFTPPALSTGVWEEPPQYSIRDLLQCWMRKETTIHAVNDGVNMLPVELFSAKSLYCVYRELDFFLHGNATLHEPVDIRSEDQSLNRATFYKHIIIFFLISFILLAIILDCKFLGYSSQWNFYFTKVLSHIG